MLGQVHSQLQVASKVKEKRFVNRIQHLGNHFPGLLADHLAARLPRPLLLRQEQGLLARQMDGNVGDLLVWKADGKALVEPFGNLLRDPVLLTAADPLLAFLIQRHIAVFLYALNCYADMDDQVLIGHRVDGEIFRIDNLRHAPGHPRHVLLVLSLSLRQRLALFSDNDIGDTQAAVEFRSLDADSVIRAFGQLQAVRFQNLFHLF